CRDVRHRRVVGDAGGRPAPDLVGAIGRLTPLGEEGVECVEIHGATVARRGARACVRSTRSATCRCEGAPTATQSARTRPPRVTRFPVASASRAAGRSPPGRAGGAPSPATQPGRGTLRPVLDLRSDTATKPTAEMLAAMARAEVGDEQAREDPTVNELQRRAAELLGQEAALFLPTATMANQIALRVLTRPGQQLIAEERTHILIYGAGGPAVHSGLVTRPVRGVAGRVTPQQIRAVVETADEFQPA